MVTKETPSVVINAKGTISYGLIKQVKDNCQGSAIELLSRVLDLRNSIDETYFEMGGIFRKIYDNQMFKDMGYEEWKVFIEEKVGYSIRKVQYLMSIYHYFAVEVGDEEVIRKIAPLGWGKCKELVGVVDPSNVDEWVKKAIDSTVTEVSKMAAEFMAEKKGFAPSMVEKAGKMISFKLYEEQLQNVEDAITIAHSISGSDIRSNNLSLIALEYVSHNGGLKFEDETQRLALIESSLKNLELGLGVKIIAIDKGNDAVMFGKQYVE